MKVVIALESYITNLQLLSRYTEDVTQHVATCSACHMVAQSSDILTIFGKKDRKGLASIMGCRSNAVDRNSLSILPPKPLDYQKICSRLTTYQKFGVK